MLTSLTHLETIRSKFTILKPIIDEVGITDKISQYYSKWLEQTKQSVTAYKKARTRTTIFIAIICKVPILHP